MLSISRILLTLPVIGLLLTTGCGRSSDSPEASTSGLIPITVQLDWVAEPEHGGFYQAQAKGYFTAAGLDVTLIQGGANAFPTQKTASGQVQFAQADSTNTILAINEGLPITQVAAVFSAKPFGPDAARGQPHHLFCGTRWQDLDGSARVGVSTVFKN